MERKVRRLWETLRRLWRSDGALAKFGKLLTDFVEDADRTIRCLYADANDGLPDGRLFSGRRRRPKTKRPPVETEGRLTIACHMKRDNDLVVCEHKIKRCIRNTKS